MGLEEIVLLFLQKVAIGLKIQQQQKGIRATGRSADSLKAVLIGGNATLVGDAAIFFQIHGRRPGRFPPGEPSGVNEEWFFRKNIPLVGITVESFLFLVRRKIARMGTDIFLGKRPGLSIEDEVDKQIAELKTAIAQNEVQAMAQILRDAVQTSFG